MNDAGFNLLWPRRGLLSAVVWLSPLAMAACGGGDRAVAGPGSAQSEPARIVTLEHEPCKESGRRVDVMDTNGDGKPDLRRVFDKSTGKELCRIVDLNRDGRPDMFEYFDDAGAVRRREYCYGDTGDVNAVEHYEHGRLASREIDATGRHKVDTWDTFDPSTPLDPRTGRPPHPARRERDTTGDGKVDQWWTWNGDKVTIVADRTGSGRPDPDSTIVLGPDNAPQDTPPPPGDSVLPPTSALAPAADGGASAGSSR